MLYLVSTPIGNLEDFSFRAIKTLQQCELILCEDTRRSSHLLEKYDIQKKLISYHKFNEKKQLLEILERLKLGQDIALISDAGTPCINDPGVILVQECKKENIAYTLIPGPCSPIAALVLSGFDSQQFQYVGFLPKSAQSFLKKILQYPGTSICLESPNRLEQTLQDIHKLDPQRMVSVVREISKTFEECKTGPVTEILNYYLKHPARGEIVLVIQEGSTLSDDLTIDETVKLLQDYHGLSLKEAIKSAAELKNIPKRDVYKLFHKD